MSASVWACEKWMKKGGRRNAASFELVRTKIATKVRPAKRWMGGSREARFEDEKFTKSKRLQSYRNKTWQQNRLSSACEEDSSRLSPNKMMMKN